MPELDKYPVAELHQISEGAAINEFRSVLQRTIENILDEDTQAQKKRTITLKVEITPNAERDRAIVEIICPEPKLAPKVARATTILIGRDAKGKATARALSAKQWDLFNKENQPSDNGS